MARTKAPGSDTTDLILGRMDKANDSAQVESVSARVGELRDLNSEQIESRTTIRDILDGGTNGLRAIIGKDFKSKDPRVPAANLMLSGLTGLAQKTGAIPEVKVDPPSGNDSDNARQRAERRARIVAGYDHAAKVPLLGPQMARWCPAYGFTPLVVEQGRTHNDDPYPRAVVRDPYMAFPGQWGNDQQPDDIAFLHMMPPRTLAERFPAHDQAIRAAVRANSSWPSLFGTTGSPTTSSMQRQGWQSQSGGGIEVYEYHNIDGIWWVLPESNILLDFTPNPISRPSFYIVKRFAFNKLVGQYDHVIGLMAAMARLNVLSVIAAEDETFAETNVVGELQQGSKYIRGRNAVNVLRPGSTVERMQGMTNPQVFTQIDRLERQLRVTAGYPVTDDAESPNSYVTGRGLEELTQSVDREVNEYFTVYRDGYEELDSRRLEWDEKVYGSKQKTLNGTLKGSGFEERYTPESTIKGQWLTRRDYGAMASMDDPQKVVALLNFYQNDIIDADTVREHVPGLGDITRISERVRQKQLEGVMVEFLSARAQQGDTASMRAVIGMLRDSDIKDTLEEIFLPDEEEQQAAQAQTQAPAPETGPPPDVQGALARMTAGGAQLGTQVQQ